MAVQRLGTNNDHFISIFDLDFEGRAQAQTNLFGVARMLAGMPSAKSLTNQLQATFTNREVGRVDYDYATDAEALHAFQELSHVEGIIPALESAHAIAHVIKVAGNLPKDFLIVANLSGRGDKDVSQAARFIYGESGDGR